MAGGEDQPQHVVLDVVVELDFVHGVFRFGELPAHLSDLALEAGLPPHAIDVATARDGGQPGTRVVGHPVDGHCTSAATRASCARSSARPTSRTVRASPAMSRADSIRQTASTVRCAASPPNDAYWVRCCADC